MPRPFLVAQVESGVVRAFWAPYGRLEADPGLLLGCGRLFEVHTNQEVLMGVAARIASALVGEGTASGSPASRPDLAALYAQLAKSCSFAMIAPVAWRCHI